jgi:hypothetical protein
MNKKDLKGSIDYIVNSNDFNKDIRELSKNFDYYSEIGSFKDWIHTNIFLFIPFTIFSTSLSYSFFGDIPAIIMIVIYLILAVSTLNSYEIEGKPTLYSLFPSKHISFLKYKKKQIKTIYKRNKFLFKIMTTIKEETLFYSNSRFFTKKRCWRKREILSKILSNYNSKNGSKKFITDISDILRELNLDNANKEDTDVIFNIFDEVTEEYRKVENRKRLITESCSISDSEKEPLLKDINETINQIPLIPMVRKL